MYCLFCGSSLPEDAPFCLKCGNLTPRKNEESGKSEHAPTVVSTFLSSDPYSNRPSTSYGPPPPEAVDTPISYASPDPYPPFTPAPPPHHRRIFPGFLKGLFSSILVILLLIGGVGGFLFFKQGALFSSVPHPTPQPTAHSTSQPTLTPQPTAHGASQPTVTPQPTAHSTSPATSPTFQSLPGTWTQCAVETAICKFSGTMTIAFGANGSFHYATGSNGIACTNSVFGDPLTGTQKACYVEAPPLTTNVWARCAVENATCSFLGTMTIAFGANGSYKYTTKASGAACTTAAFGDPLYSVAKSCYLISPPASAVTWKSCATENSTCSFTARHEVAYGTNGKYFYGSFTNGTACTNSVFGDPDSGTAKTCYYQ